MAKNLKIPSGINYACVKCGRGCEDFEEIKIDPVTIERFEKMDFSELAQDRAADGSFERPYVDSPYNPGTPMLRKIGGEKKKGPCCFLQENKLCAIHCAHGIEAKPIACRSFPYKFTETAGGTYVGLSFACTAILQNYGPAIAEQREEVEMTADFSPPRDSVSDIMLTSGIPLMWEQYQRIEGDLMEIIEDTRAPIGTRLIAQSTYLQLLSKFLHEARTTAGVEWESNAAANETPLETFRQHMRGTSAGGHWQRFFRIAEKPSSARLLRRVFLGYILAFRNTDGVRMGRLGTALFVLGAYLRHAMGRGAIETPRLNSQTYRDFMKIKFDPARKDHAELLQRYFSHALFRKDLIATETVRFTHNMMLMHYGLIHWYGAAFASAAGHPEIESEDLTEAIRTVEQYYVFHSQFSTLFTDHPKLKNLMETMFDRPIYAFAMGRHE